MSYNIGTLGLPIVLLGSLWGAVNTTLKFYEVINERRDLIFKMIKECGACPDKPLGTLELYFTNMMPLTFAVCLFLALIFYVTTTIPKYLNIKDESENNRTRFACYAISSLPAFGLLAFVCSGLYDAVIIFKNL